MSSFHSHTCSRTLHAEQAIKFAPITENNNNKTETSDKSWNELSRCHAERSECYFGGKEFAAAAADVDLALASSDRSSSSRNTGDGVSADQKLVLFQRKLLSLKSQGLTAATQAAFTEMEGLIEADYPNDEDKRQELRKRLKGIPTIHGFLFLWCRQTKPFHPLSNSCCWKLCDEVTDDKLHAVKCRQILSEAKDDSIHSVLQSPLTQ